MKMRISTHGKTADNAYEVVVDGEFCDGYCYVDVDDNGDVESYEIDIDCWGDNGEVNVNFWQQAFMQMQPSDLALEIISDCEAEYGGELGIDWHHLTQQLELYIPKYGYRSCNRKNASWDDFQSPIADEMNDLYLPSYGDGDNMATQAVTAANKLIYKWFNDGDVYDNTYAMEGWCNDISGSANWLYNHIPSLQRTLFSIKDCRNDAQYEEILYDVFTTILEDPEYLENLSKLPKIGDAYNEDGPFEFVEHEEEWDDDDDWW